MAAKLSTRTFQAIALATLVPASGAVYLACPWPIAVLVGLNPEMPVAMTVLAVALTALAVTLVWAALMLPLRARSDLTPLREELATIEAQGGFVALVGREQKKLETWKTDPDGAKRRRYYGRLAAAGLFVSSLGALASFVAWSEDQLWLELALFTAVAPLVSVYYAVRYLALTRQRSRRGETEADARRMLGR